MPITPIRYQINMARTQRHLLIPTSAMRIKNKAAAYCHKYKDPAFIWTFLLYVFRHYRHFDSNKHIFVPSVCAAILLTSLDALLLVPAMPNK